MPNISKTITSGFKNTKSEQTTAGGAILEESARYEVERDNDPYMRKTVQNSYAESPGRNENKF